MSCLKVSICMVHAPRRRAERRWKGIRYTTYLELPGQSQSLTTLGLGCSFHPLGNATRGLSLLEKYERFLVVQVAESQEYRDNETTSALPLYSYIYICYVCLGSFFFSYLRRNILHAIYLQSALMVGNFLNFSV